MVATYRSTDTDTKERFVHQQAGAGGYGGSSYLDLVAFREKDANTAWTTASDGTLEERLYYCQNQHADVVALVTAAGGQREMDRYSAYGVPFGLPVGDSNSDGDADSSDRGQISTWIGTNYDVRGDLDLEGDIDATDRTTLRDNYEGVTLGRGSLSATLVGGRLGDAGYEFAPKLAGNKYHIRNRVLNADLGSWTVRDPLGNLDSENLLEFVKSMPQGGLDPSGLNSCTAEEPWASLGSAAAAPAGAGLKWRIVINFRDPESGENGCPGTANGDCASGHCKWEGCTGRLTFQYVSPNGWAPVRRDGPDPGCLAYEYWHNTPCKNPNKTEWPKWEGPGTKVGASEQTLEFTSDPGNDPIDCGTGFIQTWCASSPPIGTPDAPGLTVYRSPNGRRLEQTRVCIGVPFYCKCR